MYFDMSELRKFSAGINANLKTTPSRVRATVKKGAGNIKNQLIDEAKGTRHFKIARTINYDMMGSGSVDSLTIAAEIGPDKSQRSARLGNIAYFGASRGGGGSLPEPRGALMAEVPNLEKYLLDMGEEIVP